MMNKEERYRDVLAQVKGLCDGEPDLVAKMANVCALLHREFGFWWTGFYRVCPEVGGRRSEVAVGAATSEIRTPRSELVLGPFQGPIACVRIGYGRGVCGTAWKESRTVVVPDVEAFPGHIACSSESRSEVVVPLLRGGEVVAVLDIDSRELATFDDIDARWLGRVAEAVVNG
jgi:GAF domain-containing protein